MGALSEISREAQLILKRLHGINSFLDDHSLGEGTLKAFSIHSLCSSMRFYLLTKTEDVLERIDIPFVIAIGLDAGLVVAVGLLVHFGELRLLLLCP